MQICIQCGHAVNPSCMCAQALRARPATRGVAVRPRAAATTSLTKAPVPLELEKGEMPLNTYGNKAPFKARVKSVERIVGPKATGETCHIIIETDGKIPFWEGQSYGVIPPVRTNPAPCPRQPNVVIRGCTPLFMTVHA